MATATVTVDEVVVRPRGGFWRGIGHLWNRFKGAISRGASRVAGMFRRGGTAVARGVARAWNKAAFYTTIAGGWTYEKVQALPNLVSRGLGWFGSGVSGLARLAMGVVLAISFSQVLGWIGTVYMAYVVYTLLTNYVFTTFRWMALTNRPQYREFLRSERARRRLRDQTLYRNYIFEPVTDMTAPADRVVVEMPEDADLTVTTEAVNDPFMDLVIKHVRDVPVYVERTGDEAEDLDVGINWEPARVFSEFKHKGGEVMDFDWSQFDPNESLLLTFKDMAEATEMKSLRGYFIGRAETLGYYLNSHRDPRLLTDEDETAYIWAFIFQKYRNKQGEIPMKALRGGFLAEIADLKKQVDTSATV